MSVELGDFVSEALVQIAKGLRDANTAISVDRGDATTHQQPLAFELAYGENREVGQGVHFDVAVSAETGKEGKAGAKFNIGVVGIGSDGTLSASESRVSRVQFSVRVSSQISSPDPTSDQIADMEDDMLGA